MMKLDRIGHEDLDRKVHDPPNLPPTEMSVDNVDYTDYRFESARLDSFSDWPVPFIDPKKLAAAGFFYIKKNDGVKCFACSRVLCGWVEGDDPMTEHQRWSGRCFFIRNIPCGNVPIGTDPSTIPKISSKHFDTPCGFHGIKYMPYSGPDNNLQIEPGSINDNTEITVFWDSNSKVNFTAELGNVFGAKEPTYASYERRLCSFANWPDTKHQDIKDLAAAGFFHLSGLPTSVTDQTMCFYCGGCLMAWESTDKPVEEHVKWFPTCKFINKVIAKKKQLEEKDNPNITYKTDES